MISENDLTFFELLAGASLSLGLAIPAFVDKIMRPKYEERFGTFRQQNRLQFFGAFETALEKVRRVKRSAETLTPEVYTTMEDLFLKWGRLRSNETRLDTLLARRKHIFVGWMMSFLISALAAGFPDVTIAQVALSQLALWFFVGLLAYSIYYVVQLFDLDDRVSKFAGTATDVRPDDAPPYASSETAKTASEEDVAKEFLRKGITLELNPTLGGSFRPDFAIPSSKNPLYFVEVKRVLRNPSTASWLNYNSRALKSKFPSAKTMIISSVLLPKMRELLSKHWDYVFDYSEIQKAAEIIKSGTAKPPSF